VTQQPSAGPNPTSRTQLRALFQRYGFRPRQELGQTFLADDNIAHKIVRAAGLTGAGPVLEIGPGAGAVTRLLAAQARRVVAIEVDPVLVSMLAETVGAGVEVIRADFLKVELDPLLGSESKGSWRCVANLPYAITGPAMLRLLDHADWFDRMVIMVQQEVADRLLAPPGSRTRGLLTVLTEASCAISAAGSVSRRCFFPQPKVDSTILALSVRRPQLVPASAWGAFERVVKAAYSTRRKTLVNALSGPLGLGLSKEDIARLLSESGVEPGRRAESLSAQEFLAITNLFLDLKAKDSL
jgi:16S rRNA (adenine1518-N6/adenine1519-N6)-dimethyltransferase